MKKYLYMSIIAISCTLMQGWSQAEDIGLGDVLIEQTTQEISQQQQNTVDNCGYSIIKLHLYIAGKNTAITNNEDEALRSIQKLEELAKTNIINTLSIAEDKEVALMTYFNECDKELQKWDSIVAYMKQEMAIFKENMQACLSDKDTSDQAYFDAIETYNQSIMESAIHNSIGYEQCAAENRIKYNAKISIVKKLVLYLGILQQKYDILYAKKDILAKNYEIFKDKILPDLNQIDTLFMQYDKF